MRYVESPEMPENINAKSIFLAGGITDCPDWQQEMVKYLDHYPITVFNPRRTDFPIHDPRAAEAQIAWEHNFLRVASAISFWFPCETLCPIVLYELGAWSMQRKPIFVGVHPQYPRRQDVEIQTKLVRPKVVIVYDLLSLARQILAWCSSEPDW
jgi:hypothetical protein